MTRPIDAFKRRTRGEKIDLLFDQSFPAVFFSMSVGLLLAAIMRDQIEPQVLYGWLAALTLTSAIRLVLFLSYRRVGTQGADSLPWETPYLVTLLLSSLVWGLGGVWMIAEAPPFYQPIIYYFIIGMAGGAFSVYAAIRTILLPTIAAVLFPATLYFLLSPSSTYVFMGVGGLLFILAGFRSTRVQSAALHRSILLTHELNEAKEQAERLAATDTLTGIGNRSYFIATAEQELKRSQDRHGPIALILLDIDHFKRINDTQGHHIGDRALQHVAGVIQGAIRRGDLCARLGGEEFTVLLPDTDDQAATLVAEQIRHAIETHPMPLDDELLHMTASFGIAANHYDLDTLLRWADQAMYRAKESGRNQVCRHEPSSHEFRPPLPLGTLHR